MSASPAKYAIIGDIHGNLDALTAVVADTKKRGVTHYAFVGDLVGYNANPCECIDLVRELGGPVVRGNHDHYCAQDQGEAAGFHPAAATVVDWTRRQLRPDQMDFLRSLPYTLVLRDFTLVHSTLDTPEMWGYVFDKFEADANFAYQRTAVCFYGHTHVPIAFEKAGDIRFGLYSQIKQVMGRRYFINVGSVGQPRDGDPRSAYVVFEPAMGLVELVRIEYDVASAQRKILEAGLPERLAQRLAAGR